MSQADPHPDSHPDSHANSCAPAAPVIPAAPESLARWQAAGGRAAALIQIDQMARINHSGGVAGGDAVLAEIARRLASFAAAQYGPDSHLARLDGPRYLLLPPPATSLAAMQAQERALHAVLAQPMVGDPAGRLSARVAIFGLGAGQSAADALAQAMPQLARATAARDGAQVKTAITGGEVAAVYQPQYAMADGRVVGVEALVRWHHPEYGALGAAPLVTAARVAGMERQLTDHVHALVLAEVAAWPAALAGTRVALNITAADLGDPGFARRFAQQLAAHGLSAARFTMELTEQAMLDDPASAADQLAEVRAMGCRVAIDDFGTGYSSLALLAQLPIDYLKIDAGFTRLLDGSNRDRIVVRAIVELAGALGLGVIAEGVETESQRDRLALLGVEQWQGFLRSGPVPGADLAAMVPV